MRPRLILDMILSVVTKRRPQRWHFRKSFDNSSPMAISRTTRGAGAEVFAIGQAPRRGRGVGSIGTLELSSGRVTRNSCASSPHEGQSRFGGNVPILHTTASDVLMIRFRHFEHVKVVRISGWFMFVAPESCEEVVQKLGES